MYRVVPIVNVKGREELETGLLSAGVNIQSMSPIWRVPGHSSIFFNLLRLGFQLSFSLPSYVAMRASLLSQFMIENKKSSVFFRFLKTIFFYKPKPRKLWVKLFYAPVTKVLESKNAIHNNRNFIIKTKRYLVINPTTDMQEL